MQIKKALSFVIIFYLLNNILFTLTNNISNKINRSFSKRISQNETKNILDVFNLTTILYIQHKNKIILLTLNQ